MPTPLTPSSSGEIVCISSPVKHRSSAATGTKRKRGNEESLPRPPLSVKTNATSSSSRSSSSLSHKAQRQASPSYTNKGKAPASPPSRADEVIILDDVDDDEPFIPSSSCFKREAPNIPAKHEWDPSSATTLPRPRGFSPSIKLRDQAYRARNAYDAKEALRTGKRKIRKEDVRKAGQEVVQRGREAVTAKMMSTLGKDSNPITNSDLYTRTDHFVSVATGHQVSNRGGGSSGAATYWTVRTAKMEEQAREKKSDLLKGLVFYINGSTGPRVSNLQVQHLITSHGGRFVPMQSSSCTHILAQNLSGSKTQKWIDGQAGRGGAKRTKVVRIEWLLDSVEKGVRLSEVPYAVIHNPAQSERKAVVLDEIG